MMISNRIYKKIIPSIVVILLYSTITWAQIPNIEINNACPDSYGSTEITFNHDMEVFPLPYTASYYNPTSHEYREFTILNNPFVLDSLLIGDYELEVELDSEYEMDFCFFIKELKNPVFEATITHSTAHDSEDGMIVMDGKLGLTYTWDQGEPPITGPIRTGLNPGKYCVTVDNFHCSVVECYTILEKEPMQVSVNTFPAVEGIPNSGGVSAHVVGGYAPYSYEWSNGSTGQTVLGMEPGNYIVSVFDAAGEGWRGSGTVPEIKDRFGNGQRSINHPICGSDDGSIHVGADEIAHSFYSFFWYDHNYEILSQNYFIDNLITGTYLLKLYNKETFKSTEIYYNIGKPKLEMESIDIQHTNGETGYIIPSIVGGQKPYHFVWEGPSINESNRNNPQLYDLGVGEYCFELTDYDGCEFSECVTIEQLCKTSASISVYNKCYSETPLGGFEIEASDVIEIWIFGEGIDTTFVGNSFLDQLNVGNYNIDVSFLEGKYMGCGENFEIEITDDYYDVVTEVTDICNGESGVISLELSGGMPSVDILWSTGETGTSISVDTAGTYSWEVNDAQGCKLQQEVKIKERNVYFGPFHLVGYECINNEKFAILKSIINAQWWTFHNIPIDQEYCMTRSSETCEVTHCYDEFKDWNILNEEDNTYDCLKEGDSIELLIDYQGYEDLAFEWGNGNKTSTIYPLESGTYIVTVTDHLGCSKSASYDVTIVPDLDADFIWSGVKFNEEKNKWHQVLEINPSISTGVSPYTYEWHDGSNGKKYITTDELYPQYSLTVTDACDQKDVVHLYNGHYDFGHLGDDYGAPFPKLEEHDDGCDGNDDYLKIKKWPYNLGGDWRHFRYIWPDNSKTKVRTTSDKENRNYGVRQEEGSLKYEISSSEYLRYLKVLQYRYISPKEKIYKRNAFYFKSLINVSGDFYTTNKGGVSDFTTYGTFENCSLCGYPNKSTTIGEACKPRKETKYFPMYYVPEDNSNPCNGGGDLYYQKNGQEFKIKIESTDYAYIINPTFNKDLLKCPDSSACFFSSFVIDEAQYPFYPVHTQTIASICDGTPAIPDCIGEPVTTYLGYDDWEDRCLYSVHCGDDSEVLYYDTEPKLYYKVDYWDDSLTVMKMCVPDCDTIEVVERIHSNELEDYFPELEEFPFYHCIVPIGEGPIISEHTIETRSKSDETTPIKLFPNPFRNEFIVESKEVLLEVQIMSPTGKVLKTLSILEKNKIEIDLKLLPPNLYLVKIRTKDHTYVRKIIKI